MPELTESRKRANKKWNDANMGVKYDHAHVLFPKGHKERIAAHAQGRSESLNAFVNRAITETMERDNANRSD